MKINLTDQFKNLQWHRLTAVLAGSKPAGESRGCAAEIMQAIIKAVSANDDYHTLFHFPGKAFDFKWRANETFEVDILFFNTNNTKTDLWRQKLQRYFEPERNQRTFKLVDTRPADTRSLHNLIIESGIMDMELPDELCLEFLGPMPFKADKGKSRPYLSKQGFIRSLETRFTNLFGDRFDYRSSGDDFFILPYYWRYKEKRHASRSEPGHTQYINGCLGKLFLKGTYDDFLPFLLLASEVHAGTKRSNSQGYFKLHFKPQPHLDTRFPDQSSLRTVVSDVINRYDSALESLSRDEMFPFDEEEFTAGLCREISGQTYIPAPNTAFLIKKNKQDSRMVEQLSVKDLIVSQYLLKTLSRPFDAMLEEESIGYRKGISRKKALGMVKRAINDGYTHLLDADIESFFYSIDLSRLKTLLNRILPGQDMHLKELLFRFIDTGYILNGTLYERLKGLAQGNPLSPLLANLYLDSFDEEIKKLDVRLIRYGDDFIIFCRSQEQALQLTETTGSILSRLGLELSTDKTAVRTVSRGFEFLGYRFDAAGETESAGQTEQLFKKPLYITEPYCMLALDGDAMEVKKDKKIIASLPLRRISEIMVMEKTLFSTQLIKTCTERKIPFTITLNNGYYITTIKPDSKQYYETAARHAAKFASLSDSEFLCIAREFASGKIKNYISLFKHKYIKGNNELIDQIFDYEARIHRAGTVHTIRGIEGAAAKVCFRGLNSVINSPFFYFEKRIRKRPDRINSLMNFGYYLLFSRINATLRAMGLNPYLGFLHDPSNDYESLVCDIQELFRARIDRFIIRLINLKIITDVHFTDSGKGYYLTREGVRKFLLHFETEMNKKSDKPVLSLKEEIYLQVHVFKQWILGEQSLTFYHWKV